MAYINNQNEPALSASSKPSKPFPGRVLGAIAAVLVLCALSFYGGVAYQKGHSTASNPSGRNYGGINRGGGFGGRSRRGALGNVRAVSSSSITVQDQRSGSNKTFSIASSTSISNNGAQASASDIKVGDMVLVRTAAGSTTATAILISPAAAPNSAPPAAGSSTPDSGASQST